MRYLIMLAILFWSTPALAGTLLLWPTVPEKPIVKLEVVDAKTAVVTDREMTEEETLKISEYEVYRDNFTSIQSDVKGVMTGKYSQVISHKGPVWLKDGVSYSIAYIADPRRIKAEIKPSGTCQVIDTGKLGGAEWLRKNGYAPGAAEDIVTEKESVLVK